MTYATKYSIPFKSVKNVSFEVKIQQDGYSGSITELKAASQPFTVDINQSDFLYAPSRLSKATLRIVTDDYMDDLFSTNPHEYRVLLEREGIVVWRGFIAPEIFTQDFSTSPVELEISCVSAMSTLEDVPFHPDNAALKFVSLWSLILKCVTDSHGGYGSLYFPWVYSTSRAAYNVPSDRINVLETMMVSERNFFDDEMEPMKMSEVLEEICKLLSWTCVDFNGDLYFVDPDHSTRETANSSYRGMYLRWYVDYQVYDMAGLFAPTSIRMQTLGFAGSGNSIDKVPGFNKVTVRTSTFPIRTIFPTEDFKSLTVFYNQPNKVSSDGKYMAVKSYLTPRALKLYRYTPDVNQTEQADNASYIANSLGATAIRRASYPISETPANLGLAHMIQVRLNTDSASNGGFYLGATKPILEYRYNLPVAAYWKGALGISFSIQLDLNFPSYSMDYFQDKAYPNFASLSAFSIPMIVKVGDKYYQNDGSWSTQYSTVSLTFNVENLLKGVFVPCNTTKLLSDPYTGLIGKLIKFPYEYPLCGELKIVLLKPAIHAYNELAEHNFPGFYISDSFEIKYTMHDSVSSEISEGVDQIYYNVVNESYMNEADQIDLKISSWDNSELCYSKVILGSSFLTNNLYCVVADTTVRPEEMIINRIKAQYSNVKDKTTQILKYSPNVLPFCELTDDFFSGKVFQLIGGSIDFKNETFKTIAIEKR